MALPNNVALNILIAHGTEKIRNLFAQSSARYVLYEVNETPNNFPQFDPLLEDKVTTSAYAILAAGASLHEITPSQQSINAIGEAASLLTNIHFSQAIENAGSSHHILIASMAFYACGEYSRAFVTIRPIKLSSRIANIISLYLSRNRNALVLHLNAILLAKKDSILCISLVCESAIEQAIAQALSQVLEFQITGECHYLESALDAIDAGMEIAAQLMSPSLWWVARLLKLMIQGLGKSSPWNSLPPFFSDTQRMLRQYIQLSVFISKPLIELWHSQIDAIPIALDVKRSGTVVNMKTSSGKTRIAELAILQTLEQNPNAKILYIAPYRSLALEIEQSLSQVFDILGYHTSHLYGGFRFSSADKLLAQGATITIATPEKTRAIVRSSPELLAEFKLIIIDEGHLIGVNQRHIRNELFIDHLRVVAQASNAKMLLLSAVLPNPADLAQWVSNSPNNVARSEWKPSAERFGFLKWDGIRVSLNWKGEFESFNPNFVESTSLGWGRRRTPFPNNKNEAIAATAVRLTSIGPVMIYCGQARSIPVMASIVITALGENPTAHPWPKHIWDMFTSCCLEELGIDTIEYKAAHVGIICHSNSLPPLVRLATERLMRSMPPKVIVATSTLAQGVNIGISSVIIASPYIGAKAINHSDFWNICGRAGRAFVDGEGKILYAIDATDKSSRKINKNIKMAEAYFNAQQASPVTSGLLDCLVFMRQVANSAGIDFDTLIGLVAENDFNTFSEDQTTFNAIYAMIDDALLAIIEDPNIRSENDNPYDIVDRVFRTSLAAIQVKTYGEGMVEDDIVHILQNRLKYLLNNCPDENERQACVTSGLPYRCAKNLYRDRAELKAIIDKMMNENFNLTGVIGLLEWIEIWARLNGDGVVKKWPNESEFNKIREGWITGTPVSELTKLSKQAKDICKDIYGYQLPWIIHAGSQILAKEGHQEHADILAFLATIVEFGLPNLTAVSIFLAGIKSRVAACELAALDEEWESTPHGIRKQLHNSEVVLRLNLQVSNNTWIWLQLLEYDTKKSSFKIPKFPAFIIKDWEDLPKRIYVRKLEDSLYLCTPDGHQHTAVETNEKWPFDTIANDLRFAFVLNNSVYQLEIRDPHLF